MTVDQELLARALGNVAAATIEAVYHSGCLKALVENDAVKLLQSIQNILDDENLSDFQCVEEIVSVMAKFNVSTNRHDFG